MVIKVKCFCDECSRLSFARVLKRVIKLMQIFAVVAVMLEHIVQKGKIFVRRLSLMLFAAAAMVMCMLMLVNVSVVIMHIKIPPEIKLKLWLTEDIISRNVKIFNPPRGLAKDFRPQRENGNYLCGRKGELHTNYSHSEQSPSHFGLYSSGIVSPRFV